MRASLMTRAGTVAAAAAIATTGVMATAAAADASTAHHPRLATHLGVGKRHAVEHGHHFTVLLGRLSTRHHNMGLRGRLVFLDRVTKKGLVQIGHERTGAHGRVAFAVDPKGVAVFVLVFKGTPHLHASHSHAVIVKH
jgi:hypothetical protein